MNDNIYFLKRHYDIVFLSNTPSFYKVNLCSQIAMEGCSLLLVLYGYGAEAVNKDLEQLKKAPIDFYFIHEGNTNDRNKLVTLWNLVSLMTYISYKKILFSGWMTFEYNVFSFFSPQKKNVIISESSIWDISLIGMKGLMKKILLKRMSTALPSGAPHAAFFRSIGFRGEINETGGVGLFKKGDRSLFLDSKRHMLRYIFVGRLIDVKNVSFLIQTFNENGKSLTIVGKGELEKKLKKQSKSNISFTGFIENDELGSVYTNHDVFILPSKSETWGLVVEEALFWGLPVIVSSCVGSSIDLVENTQAGIIFDLTRKDSLALAIKEMEMNYSFYKRNVLEIDFYERDRKQVKVYTDLINK